jgi:hypothetical protein
MVALAPLPPEVLYSLRAVHCGSTYMHEYLSSIRLGHARPRTMMSRLRCHSRYRQLPVRYYVSSGCSLVLSGLLWAAAPSISTLVPCALCFPCP